MSKNLRNRINRVFKRKPSVEQKAWSIINQFYHLVLSKMENDNISRADLARKLNKSRASVSQLFNKTPNLTVKRMVEIADSVDLEINLTTNQFLSKQKQDRKTIVVYMGQYEDKYLNNDVNELLRVSNLEFSDSILLSNNDIRQEL